MQNFIILSTISIWFAQALCQIKEDSPQYVYPSIDSPFIMNMDEFTTDTNLQFSIIEQVNSTYYYSMSSIPQPIQLNGIIIASSQYDMNNQNSVYFEGNIALLVQNSTGYYSYLISPNQQTYSINLLGNPITMNVVCYSIGFKNYTILAVSCISKSQTEIIYQYNLENTSFLQPSPYQTNFSLTLTNITNSLLGKYFYNTFIFAYTSQTVNQTTIIFIYYEQFDYYYYDEYLTDIDLQFLLFIDSFIIYQQVIFKKSGKIFLKLSMLQQSEQLAFIATQNSILIVQVFFFFKVEGTLIDEIPYPQGFQLGIESKVQLFTDDQYIIISDSYTFLVYQQVNQKLFWQYQLQQQSLIQYDGINKIITIITPQSIQAFQLFKPQIYLYFNSISSGILNINLKGLSLNCSFQLEYQVILNNSTGPYVNYYDTYQVLNYQESQIQCLSCLFTGSNLTYSAQTNNIQSSYHSLEINDLFSRLNFQIYYIYSNPIYPQQYAIFYQLENSFNLYVIYCGQSYCKYFSNYETFNQTAILTPNGQINSLSVQCSYYGFRYICYLTYNILNQLNTEFICVFGWRRSHFDYCYPQNIEISLQPPNIQIQLGNIGQLSYYLISNPYIFKFQYNLFQVRSNFQYVPRQIYYNDLLYNNLLFIDNIYQLNVYELITQGYYLNYITSIQYPLQQGNTSVGVGLLEKAIVITQIDDQGNQYVLFYDRMILRPINIKQQPQSQSVQIPSGAQIQFPIVSSYTNSKFYLVWQYNQNSEIAVLQYSNTINNMLLTSIYIDGQINSIQAISQGIQDVLLCQYNQSKILQITIQNQFFIQLSSNLLLQNETFSNVTIVYQAQNQQQQVSIIKYYTFINEIFKITLIQDYKKLQVINNLWFKFLIIDYYQGLVNTYKSNNQQNTLGPFIISNNFVSVNPVPQLFISNSSILNGFSIYFQNNSGVYLISDFQSGQIQQITKFADNLNCPILYQDIEITSICQQSPTELIVYSDTAQNYNLNQPLNLVNGFQDGHYLVLNFGQVVQLIIDHHVTCQYTNENITITNVFLLRQYILKIVLQIQNSDTFIILKFNIQSPQECETEDQQQLWIDKNRFGTILYFDTQFLYTLRKTLLTVTTTKMSIIYEFDLYSSKFNVSYLISQSSEMIGIQTKVIDNYVVAIYNTTNNKSLNYTVIVYSFKAENDKEFPMIAYYNQFPSSSQQFYICEDGTIVYTYIDKNQTGFSYLQVLPYVYVAIDSNNLTLISKNNTYAINNYITQVSVGNQFNEVNITFDITYTNYIGVEYNGLSTLGTADLILVIISALSIIGFVSFVVYKIQTRNKME